MFPVLRGGNRYLRMTKCRSGDINDVDQGRLDNFTPISRSVLPAELPAGGLHTTGTTTTNAVHFDMRLEREEFGRLPPGIGMSSPHEAIPNHSDAQCPGHIKLGLN